MSCCDAVTRAASVSPITGSASWPVSLFSMERRHLMKGVDHGAILWRHRPDKAEGAMELDLTKSSVERGVLEDWIWNAVMNLKKVLLSI